MLKDKGNWGDFLERFLTAILLTCLILSYQQASPTIKLSLAQKLQDYVRINTSSNPCKIDLIKAQKLNIKILTSKTKP